MSEDKKLLELIREKKKEGQIVFYTIQGLMSADLEGIIKQPAEGLLYDLNRDEATAATWIGELENEDTEHCKDFLRTWVNNYAVALVIKKLKEKLDEQESG